MTTGVLGLAALLSLPLPAGGLRIAAPSPADRLSGTTTLRAAFGDAAVEARAQTLTFSVDGRLACRLRRPPWECAWDAGSGLRPRVVRAVAQLRTGERLVASVRTGGVDLTLAVDVDLVQVTATVTDGKGRLVRGLPRSAFRVLEDGVPQEVSHFLGPDEPREIVVAVDMSGSMDEAMPRVREAVAAFLAALRPDDHVTLLAFNDGIFTLARRETDPGVRERAAAGLTAWGGTALHDAILRGMEALAPRKGRKALVVFSDGDDESSRATMEDVRERAERSDAPAYMIGLGRGAREAEYRAILGDLARMSGGRAFHTESPGELREVFASIADELDSQYVLAYASTRPERDGSWRAMRVEAGRDRRVRARQGYRAEARP
jgi:Ca-activated chloride channel family protein